MASTKEYLCNTSDSVMLLHMGAAKPILKSAQLSLVKNASHALVGMNGVGKSSLLGMIQSEKIAGLTSKENIKIVEIKEVNEKNSPHWNKSVQEFFEKTSPATAPTKKDRTAVLKQVGFCTEAKDDASIAPDLTKKVSELSGGWRMRLSLAIVLSELETAEGKKESTGQHLLLLLDEPTNHLDKHAIFWLQGFLNELKPTAFESCTKVIVSHDYNFLKAVCTEIIEIRDLKLNYSQGVEEYLEKNPTIKQQMEDHMKAGAANVNSSAASVKGSPTVNETSSTRDRDPDSHRPLIFPLPDPLETGWKRTTCCLEVKNLTFSYDARDSYDNIENPVLDKVDLRINLESKFGLIGDNGSGKSTLMKFLSRDLDLVKEETDTTKVAAGGKKPKGADKRKQPSITRHRNLRIAYVAQDATAVLAQFEEGNAIAYIRARYTPGYDIEIQNRIYDEMMERDRKAEIGRKTELARKKAGEDIDLETSKRPRTLLELAKIYGPKDKAYQAPHAGCRVKDIVGRQWKGNEAHYEVVWNDDDASTNGNSVFKADRNANRNNLSQQTNKLVPNSIEPYDMLCRMGVSGLCHRFDLKEQSRQSGLVDRPVWDDEEVLSHLKDFGLDEHLIRHTKIGKYSQGQKARLALAAALWIKPHCLLLDEPSNFIDSDTLESLEKALIEFDGCTVIISHNEAFLNRVSKKIIKMENGKLRKM